MYMQYVIKVCMIMYVSMYEVWGSQTSLAAGSLQEIWPSSFMKMLFSRLNEPELMWVSEPELICMKEPA